MFRSLGPSAHAFHSTSLSFNRYPALATKISRYANVKNLRKIKQLKQRLGDSYKEIGRDKRQSPYSERNSPSKPTQPPSPPEYLKPIQRYLVSRFNHTPKHFIPGRALSVKLENENGLQVRVKKHVQADAQSNASLAMPSMAAFKKGKVESDSSTLLRLPKRVVPAGSLETGGIPKRTAKGPFYQFGLTRPELSFLFEYLPMAKKDEFSSSKSETDAEQQAELVRRIISVSSGNMKGARKFNVARSVELFQKHALDTGSAPVQGFFVMTHKSCGDGCENYSHEEAFSNQS
jgi:hypothetical protein